MSRGYFIQPFRLIGLPIDHNCPAFGGGRSIDQVPPLQVH